MRSSAPSYTAPHRIGHAADCQRQQRQQQQRQRPAPGDAPAMRRVRRASARLLPADAHKQLPPCALPIRLGHAFRIAGEVSVTFVDERAIHLFAGQGQQPAHQRNDIVIRNRSVFNALSDFFFHTCPSLPQDSPHFFRRCERRFLTPSAKKDRKTPGARAASAYSG